MGAAQQANAFLRFRRRIAALPAVEAGRRRRYELFVQRCALKPDEPILDLGVGKSTTLARYNRTNRIVGVDVVDKNRGILASQGVELIVGDARNLPFPDRAFPIVFCNSLIEHVLEADRGAVAAEIRRVGARYWVQTPNKLFPLEPHYMLPFVQFLPRGIRYWMERRFNSGEPIRLLTRSQLQGLFPDGELISERVLGLTKSLIVFRR